MTGLVAEACVNPAWPAQSFYKKARVEYVPVGVVRRVPTGVCSGVCVSCVRVVWGRGHAGCPAAARPLLPQPCRPTQPPASFTLSHILPHFLSHCRSHSFPVQVGAIVPWNYPFHNVLNPLTAALFTGNALVIKVGDPRASFRFLLRSQYS